MATTKLIKLADALDRMEPGDLLAFTHTRDLESVAIAIAGRSEVSHIGSYDTWRGVPMCVHAVSPDACAVSLANLVARQPGRIRVYEANAGRRWPEYDRQAACRYMIELTGRPYNRKLLRRFALSFMPLVRLVMRLVGCQWTPDTDDDSNGTEDPVCSTAKAMADQIGGGVDPVKELAASATSPSDLVKSPFYSYRFTLEP